MTRLGLMTKQVRLAPRQRLIERLVKRWFFTFFACCLLGFAIFLRLGAAQSFVAENRLLSANGHHGGAEVSAQAKMPFSTNVSAASRRGSSFETPANAPLKKEFLMDKQNEPLSGLIWSQNFRYRVERCDNPSGEIIVLLHGSGGDETTLFSFARPIWPRATLVGIRGRLVQKGETRWFRKITPTKFDQNDVVKEADAFVKFLTRLGHDDNYDLSRVTFVGYSNGANLLAVIMMKYPDLVRRAILLRSMPVLDNMPEANLSKTKVLIISGKKDALYSPFQPALSALLKKNGAKVENYMIDADHMIGQADSDIVGKWVVQQNTSYVSTNIKTDKANH